MVRSSRTMTQPTRGLGVVVNRPRAASSSARSMRSRSRSLNTIVPAATQCRSTRLAPRRRLDFPQCIAEISSILEAAIYRCKADVADFVELVEFLHDHLAHLPGRYFAFAEAKYLLHDAFDGLVDVFGGD